MPIAGRTSVKSSWLSCLSRRRISGREPSAVLASIPIRPLPGILPRLPAAPVSLDWPGPGGDREIRFAQVDESKGQWLTMFMAGEKWQPPVWDAQRAAWINGPAGPEQIYDIPPLPKTIIEARWPSWKTGYARKHQRLPGWFLGKRL